MVPLAISRLGITSEKQVAASITPAAAASKMSRPFWLTSFAKNIGIAPTPVISPGTTQPRIRKVKFI